MNIKILCRCSLCPSWSDLSAPLYFDFCVPHQAYGSVTAWSLNPKALQQRQYLPSMSERQLTTKTGVKHPLFAAMVLYPTLKIILLIKTCTKRLVGPGVV